MSRKALKVMVEVNVRAVSCPGVHLPSKDDVYLSMCFMDQYRQSECLPATFPLLFYERMTFEKIFRHAVDPGDIAVMLEYETVRIELVQLIPPVGDTLACLEEDARCFLFPEPKLVPSVSGVDREVLMTRAPHFPGIAPRLEFSTKTTIIECSADAEINIYPNVPMRPQSKRKRNHSSRPRTLSPQRKQPQNQGRRRGGRICSTGSPSYISRSRSLPPLRAGSTRRLAQLSLAPTSGDWDATSTSHPMPASWPRVSGSASPHHSAELTNSTSPLTWSSATVRLSPTSRRKSLSSGLVGGISEDNSSSSDDPLDYLRGPDTSRLWQSYREQARHSRSQSSSHKEWEEVQERVRGLLTTPKAVRRLVNSLIEQKRALGIFGSKHKLSDNLTAHQWTLLEKTLSVLTPFEELTRKTSSSVALASDVIPAVTVLLRLLTKEMDEDHGIKTMKGTLAAAVWRRFFDMEKTHCIALQLYSIQGIKIVFFSNINAASEAKEMVVLELQKVSGGEAEKPKDLGEPPVRKLRMTEASSSLDSVFDEIADEQESTSLSSAPVGSSVSHIVDENQNRLTAANAEKLLFIKKNLPLTFLKQA